MVTQKEVLLWSMIIPGSGQIRNGKWGKGIVLLILGVIYILKANLNEATILSIQGEIEKAIFLTNDQWLLFFPCLYFFAMWDAWKDAGGSSKYAFLPFVFAAYFATVGCFYHGSFCPFQLLLGPIWLPLLCVIPGVSIGFLFQILFLKLEQS